jgi:hypothetical protein
VEGAGGVVQSCRIPAYQTLELPPKNQTKTKDKGSEKAPNRMRAYLQIIYLTRDLYLELF